MKRRFIIWISILSLLLLFGACTSPKDDLQKNYPITVNTSELVVFTAPDNFAMISVKEYLDGLVAAGEISYTIEDGMIISLNGTENITQVNSGSYWMIYSDLLEKDGVIYADPTYGTYNHNGGTLASCSYGAESMPVIAGYTYALVFEEMTW